MPKSKTRRKPPARRPSTVARRRPAVNLIEGVAGPAGVRLRLARPGDAEAVLRLLPLAEPSLAEEGAMMLEHPMLAAAIHSALQSRSNRPPLLTGIPTTGKNPYDLVMALSMLLVAVDEQDTVLGVLMALPPVRVLAQFMKAGVPLPDILFAAQTVVKMKAVAVDEAVRGRGIGTALINVCVQVFTSLGWQALYGQFGKDSGLAAYYSRLGFTVRGRREGLDFGHLVTFPLAARPLGGEQLFVRWLSDLPPEPGAAR